MDHERDSKVLMNHLILENIFSYLDVTDLKSCRRVCHKWDEISTPTLVKSCVCVIGNNWNSSNRDLKSFDEIFPDQNLFHFKSFSFAGEFAAADLKKFFSDRKYIKELSLVSVDLSDEEEERLESFDISAWTGLQLDSLHIHCEDPIYADGIEGPPTEFIVPLSYISTIKKLYLCHSSIIFDGRIAPTKVEIGPLWPFPTVKLPPDYVVDLNERIDMTDLKELQLIKLYQLEFRLDLTKCLTLKKLSIHNVTLNLSMLPPTVEELSTFGVGGDFWKYNPNDSFPHLKSLETEDEGLISRCPNLVRFIVGEHCNLDSLPNSVKIIKFGDTDDASHKLSGERYFELEKFVFHRQMYSGDHFNYINRIINRFNPKTIVFSAPWMCHYNNRNCGGGSDALFTLVANQMDVGRAFVLRKPECINRNPINNRKCEPVVPFLLEPAEFNLCKNGFGKKIGQSEFDKWVDSY